MHIYNQGVTCILLTGLQCIIYIYHMESCSLVCMRWIEYKVSPLAGQYDRLMHSIINHRLSQTPCYCDLNPLPCDYQISNIHHGYFTDWIHLPWGKRWVSNPQGTPFAVKLARFSEHPKLQEFKLTFQMLMRWLDWVACMMSSYGIFGASDEAGLLSILWFGVRVHHWF